MIMEKDSSRQDPDDNAGRHLRILATLWRKVVFAVFAVAAVGGAGVMILKAILPKYETSADVAIIPTDVAVAIDKRFDAATGSRRLHSRRDLTSRRAALVGLVHSGDLAKRVVERLGELLEGYEYPLDQLLEDVSVELVTIGAFSRMNQSDLIRITVNADSPENAAIIANAWAEEYVIFVNRLYEKVSQPVIARVQNEMEKTEKNYRNSQKQLEVFLSNSQTARYTQNIESNNETIKKYEEIRRLTITTLTNSSINSLSQQINHLHAQKRILHTVLAGAKGLLSQIEKGDDAGIDSNMLAIRMLKLQAYTTQWSLPENIELSLSGRIERETSSASEQIADVKSLIASLEERHTQIDQEISLSVSDLSSILIPETQADQYGIPSDLQYYILHGDKPLRNLISKLELENQSLQRKIEAENFELHNLTQKRDLLRSGMEALQNEGIELQLATVAASSEVRLASPAVISQKSAWPSPLLVAAACGTVTLPAAVFLIFFMNLWGRASSASSQKSEMERPEKI